MHPKLLINLISFFTLISLSLIIISAQTPSDSILLKENQTLERRIKSDETHTFTISLKTGQTARVEVVQKDIDVIVSLFAPNGKLIVEMDGRGGSLWREVVTAIAEKDAMYLIKIKSYGASELIGSYQIKLLEQRKTEPKDYKIQQAEKAIEEGRRLYEARNRSLLEGAAKKFEEAIILWRELGDKNWEAVSQTNWGLVLVNLRKINESITAHNSALGLYKEIKEKRGEAVAAIYLGNIYFDLSQLNQAKGFYEQALSNAEELEDIALKGDIANNLGNTCYELGQYANAVVFFEQALPLLKKAKSKTGEADSLNGLGNVYNSIGQPGKAEAYYKQVLGIRKETKNRGGEGIALSNIGNVYFIQSQFEKAKEYYEQSLVIRREIKDKRREGITLNSLGRVSNELGQYEKAKEYFSQALIISREFKNRTGESSSLQGLGNSHLNSSQYQKAIEYYEQALAIVREIKNVASISGLLNSIGLIYRDLGQKPKAIDYFEKGLINSREIGDKRAEGAILNNLGVMYSEDGQNEKALDYYEKALRIAKEINNPLGEASNLGNVGGIYKKLGEYEKARENHEKSLTIFRNIGAKYEEAINLNNLGDLYIALKLWNEAKNHLNPALSISLQIKSPHAEIVSLSNLMTFHQSQNQTLIAIFYGKQAVNNLQLIRSNIKGLDKDLQESFLKRKEETYRKLADLLIEQGRFREAQTVLEMLKESEYFEFVRRDKAEIEKLSKRIDLTKNEKDVLERYLKFSDSITAFGEELRLLEEKKEKLSQGETLSQSDQTRINELKKLIDEANQAFQIFLDKDLANSLSRDNVKNIELERNLTREIANLDAGTVSVYTVLVSNRYRAILTTPLTQTDGKTDISLVDLNKKIFAFREALTDPKSDPKPLGKQLYDILIKPIEKDLQGAKAKKIIWSLDGPLRYLPIASLWDGNQYLVEKYQNIILTSSTRNKLKGEKSEIYTALAGGVSIGQDILFPTNNKKVTFIPLPQVTREIRQIVGDKNGSRKGILDGKILLDDDFSLEKISSALLEKNIVGKRKYNLMHLASHFTLGSNTSNSFLLLGDGKHLTLDEIKNFPEFNLNDMELVTLSACNTGFTGGTGAEIDSLATLFENRGAKATLSSLWEVSDDSTYRLMIEFYRIKKAKPGISKSEALRQSQIKLLNDKTVKYSHPYYWSSFVLVGNWR
jgi:CHAT domain-containing protein/Tfp pilus assembly protein PilF